MLFVSDAFVAQMVERRTFNPVVAGSSPAEGAFVFFGGEFLRDALRFAGACVQALAGIA